MTLLLSARRSGAYVPVCAFACAGALIAAAAEGGCYTAGSGQPPPTKSLYFPVGLAVSEGGNVLYVVNSDFDLQWNGGTLQSYDLFAIRQAARRQIAASLAGGASCVTNPDAGALLGQGCASPDRTQYVQDSVIIGAFATDLQLSQGPATVAGRRLYAPIRGNASITWAEVKVDTPCDPNGPACAPPDVFTINCGNRLEGRCDASHQAGDNALQGDNTRRVTMPGEPFGMAQTEDGTAIAVTHQTSTQTSLLTATFDPSVDPSPVENNPDDKVVMQFVLDGVPVGGNGIAAIPHDPDAVQTCDAPPHPGIASDGGASEGGADGGFVASNTGACVRPAFIQTSHNVPELDLLRYYSDNGSTIDRPYLQREAAYSLTANSIGSDSRGIVIDPTPRLACKAKLGPNPSPSDLQACGQRPARLFFANRTPPSLVVGEVGLVGSNGLYNPDAFTITGNVNTSVGTAKVYLAPIIDPQGHYQLRVFVVCFDSNSIFIYDPENQATEAVVFTGQGPFAMAFDPMPLNCIAISDPQSPAWTAAKCPQPGSYRFGYLANFTQSYLQMIDLDASSPSASYTFEQFVYTLGTPTQPKGQ